MRKVNYKSDFDFVMRLKDASGKDVPFPECDWDAEFWTSSKQNAYRASCIGGEYVNCFREADGGIHFVFDNHHLGMGALKWEPHFRLPNDIYPDSVRDTYSRTPLEIELVSGQGDEPTEAEVEYVIPYIKGDKGDAFTFKDFTPEQIAELQKPAKEAADSATKTEGVIKEAEKQRVVAEHLRDEAERSRESVINTIVTNENERILAENSRVTAEEARVRAENARETQELVRARAENERAGAETKRASDFLTAQTQRTDDYNAFKATAEANEQLRVSAENARVTAENARAEAETARAGAEQTRVGNESTRTASEQTRVSNESARVEAETARATAETNRVSAEQTRVTAEEARVTAENDRVSAESSRVTAENTRAAEFAGFATTIAAKQDKLTTTEDLSLSEANVLTLTDKAKMRLFIDMWNTAWGKYGKYDPVNAPDPQHPFYGNEIWMTYEEAVVVYSWGNKLIEKGFSASATTAKQQIRTNLPPINTDSGIFLNLSVLFLNQQKMEVCMLTPPECSWIHLVHLNNTWLTSVFSACEKLRKVLGIMDLSYFKTGDNIFVGCVSLEDIQIFGLKANFDISSCPKFSVGTMSYLVNNAANTTPITVKVHPDVYAKLTDETNTEWHQVLLDAAEKNIIFATPT